MVPYEMSLRLFEAAAGPKEFVPLQGPHDEGGWTANPEFARALEHFISRQLGPPITPAQ